MENPHIEAMLIARTNIEIDGQYVKAAIVTAFIHQAVPSADKVP
jgi:hypothetical protein